jgi:hypothetical protein
MRLWKRLSKLRIIIIAIAVIFIAIGTAFREPMAVYRKAAAVCLECIGIG